MTDAEDPDDADRNFIRNMTAARTALGWTQTRLAEELQRLGVDTSQSAVSRIEKGERDIRLPEARALATAFGTSLDALSGPPDDFAEVLAWSAAKGRFVQCWHAARTIVAEYADARAKVLEWINSPRRTLSTQDENRLRRMTDYTLTFERPESLADLDHILDEHDIEEVADGEHR